MEEEKLEQPQEELISQGEGTSQENIGQDLDAVDGSKLGKFKDTDALLSAYNALQSDYTKKCQALSSLQKKLQDNKDLLQEALPQDNEEKNSEKVKNDDHLHNAKDLNTQLKEVLENDISSTEENGKEELSQNFDKLQDFVFSTPELKDKILQRYFTEINIPPSPKLMGGDKGGGVVLSPVQKPKTLREAERVVIDLLTKPETN